MKSESGFSFAIASRPFTRFQCVKFLHTKIWSCKYFDKFQVWLQGQKSRHWQSRWSFFRNAFVRVWWYNFSHRRALPQAWLRGLRATMRPLPCLWNNPDVKPCAGCVPWLWYKFSHTEEGAPPPLAGGALGVLPSAESSCSGIWERASCAQPSCLSCEGGGCRAGNGPTPVWRHHHTSFKRTSHQVSPFLM